MIIHPHDGICHRGEIALINHETSLSIYCFWRATCLARYNRCTTRQGFDADRRKVIFACGIDEDVCFGIQLGEFLKVLGTLDASDALSEIPGMLNRNPNYHTPLLQINHRHVGPVNFLSGGGDIGKAEVGEVALKLGGSALDANIALVLSGDGQARQHRLTAVKITRVDV